VIELVLMSSQTGFDIAKSLSASQLREGHDEILVNTTEPFNLMFALVTGDTSPERVHWQMIHHLRKNELSCVHDLPPWKSNEEHAA